MSSISRLLISFSLIPSSYMPKLVSERRLCDAVDLMLSMQNWDGGFGSYGPAKGPQWLELLNPDCVFGE